MVDFVNLIGVGCVRVLTGVNMHLFSGKQRGHRQRDVYGDLVNLI
jgi:hypothetical protein